MHITLVSARDPSTVSGRYKMLLHDSSLGLRGMSTSTLCVPPYTGSLLVLKMLLLNLYGLKRLCPKIDFRFMDLDLPTTEIETKSERELFL